MGPTSDKRSTTTSGMRQRALGQTGEDLAAHFLQRQGMVIIERNFRCARGEIDIIARDGEAIVFVEVKTRRTLALGSPLEAVTEAKLRRIRMLSGIWLRGQSEFFATIRIDALGIVMEPAPDYSHRRNAQVDS
ncbi:MAG: YraN family protein [Brevibacterium sp.]|uniref:YraN family protein n=1 Tax=Brevibacterium sp. TaxID=1701 RepID=UPI002647050D|nr:YraN family protein [Brevibacterium sp.]MDN5807516.1 YraN family protein [Brevibacterium sp.]MDN5833342.1 YraN family protein [Brevibacterium sp.]MDN5877007.1 YraN family protein [Brevibacterium sp.]MDN5908637.1 YraN family protein [Brevibacterium sp.]MDN6157313.1 YraN family protein [Brevibacterium sp.]